MSKKLICNKLVLKLSLLILSLGICFNASFTFATVKTASNNTEILLVSDIDDTIKLSHVLSLGGAIARAHDSKSWFLGLNNLYQLIQQDNPSSSFAYISGAPEFISESTHKELLASGKFPAGKYIARTKFVSTKNHKLTAIRNLLNIRKPKKVILVGDNGEADAVIYKQITEEYKNSGIQFFTFIHIVYSKQNSDYASKLNPTFPGQLLFVTAIEAGLELRRQNLITETSTQQLVDQLSDRIAEEKDGIHRGVLAFPSFVDCRGFQWPITLRSESLIRDMLHEQILIDKLDRVKAKIKYRCSIASVDLTKS